MSASPALAPRLAALIRLLGSPHDGEVLAAATALRRTLAAEGSDLHDLASELTRQVSTPASVPAGGVRVDEWNWRAIVRWLQRHPAGLTRWEQSFVTSLARFRSLSPKQRASLSEIVAKVREARHA